MSTNFKADDWVSLAEAARIRGVTRQAISKLARSNRVRTFELGGHVLIHKDDIRNFQPKKAGRPKQQ